MTNEQKIAAVYEMVKGLSADEIRGISYELDDTAEAVAKVECEVNGHQVDNDHCGRPEHRFCRHCFQRETDIEQARQAKANEAADGKSALPSASLGLGSILLFILILFGSCVYSHGQSADCPVDKVCISPEAARTALKNADLVEAQKTEIGTLTQAIEDYKKLAADLKIEIAKAVGEKTQLESQLVRYNAIIDLLLKNTKRKCYPFSICVGS